MKNYQSNFANEYGEKWFFEFDYDKNYAYITGDDVGYEKYPVYDGLAIELILNEQESNWLMSVWKEAIEDITNILYLSMNTKFINNNKYCELSNNYCPVCLNQKKNYENHHCIPSKDGGFDEYYNILRVCSTCHAIITRGSVEDCIPMFFSAVYHQIMYFGMKFIPKGSSNKGRYKGRNFLKKYPKFKREVDYYNMISREEQEMYNNSFKTIGKYFYQYYRDIIRGIWSWERFPRREETFGGN